MLLLVLGLGWRIYASQPPPDLGDVLEVTHLYLVNMTSGTAVMNLVTPTADGDYQITIYADWPDVSGADSTITNTLHWTDTRRSPNIVTSTPLVGSVPYTQTNIMHVVANTPIQLSVGYNAGTTNVPYDEEIVLTKQ